MVALVGSQSPYVLDEDPDVGFRAALANNQLNLAMHYLVVRLEEMDAEIEKLRDSSSDAVAEVKAPTKKATAKKAATRKKPKETEESTTSEPKTDEGE